MFKKILATSMVMLMLLCMMPVSASAAENSYVRVLLSTNMASTINVQVNGSYGIPNRSDITLQQGDYTITNSGGTLLLSGPNVSNVNMGTSFTFQQYSSSSLSYLYLRNVSRSYLGDITFTANYNSVQCINRVFIEDYVIGVIRGEMGESFPLDALRAQAVAARTYVYRQMKTSGSYDIGDTSSDQVYRGYSSSSTKCIQAVNDTVGQLVYYGSSPITTYYGASNGGQVELIGNKWSDRTSGPFSQMKDDPYDLRNPESPVDSITISKSGSISNYGLDQLLRQRMNGYYGSILGVQSIELSNPRMLVSGSESSRYYLNATFHLILPADGGNYGGGFSPGWGSSGIVGGVVGGGTTSTDYSSTTTNYTGETKIQTVTLNTQNDLISVVSSSKKCSLFTVVDTGSAFRLEARRYGHGVGLSQRGAQQMADEGIGYQQILSFYYPNTTINTLSFVRSTTTGTGNVPGDDGSQIGTGTGNAIGTGIVTASSLNVRSQPSTSATKLGSLGKNASVSILSESGGFYGISYGGTTGYVSTQYISVTMTGGTSPGTETPGGATGGSAQSGLISLSSASSNLNVRTGPSTSYGVAGKLKHGDSVSITGTSGDWSAITSTKASGYVMTKYVTITSTGGSGGTVGGGVVGGDTGGGTATATPTPTPTPTSGTGGIVGGVVGGSAATPTPSPTPTPIPGGVVGGVVGGTTTTATPTPTPTNVWEVTPTPTPISTTATGTIRTNGGLVNVRSGPSTSNNVVVRVGNNVTVTVLAQNGDWYKITIQDKTGYISASYVTVSGSVGVESGTGSTNTGSTGGATTGNAGAYYIKLNSVSSKMNLRSGPSTSTSALTTMGHGAVVSATGVVEGEWSQVVYNGKTGYVKTQYLSIEAPVGASYNTSMATTTGNVNLRSKASTASDSSVLAVVPKGTKVAIVKKGSEFTECVYNGKTGFISNKFLTF